MSFKQPMLAETIRVPSLLHQKMLLDTSKITSASIGLYSPVSVVITTDIKWLQDFFVKNDVGDLN